MELKSFCMLLSLYESQLTNCECDHFPTLLERTTSDPKAKIKSRMGKYVTVIKSLKAEFDRRFQDFAKVGQQMKFGNKGSGEERSKKGQICQPWKVTQLTKRLIFRFKKLVYFQFEWIETIEYVTMTQLVDRRMVKNIPSFDHNFHHISELDCICKKGLLADDTVEFKSFKNWSMWCGPGLRPNFWKWPVVQKVFPPLIYSVGLLLFMCISRLIWNRLKYSFLQHSF